MSAMPPDEHPRFDPTVASSARIYDYLIGGKDHYPADREIAEQLLRINPTTGVNARENRRFVLRATRYVATRGIRQFIDVGAGIPHRPNVHDVARSIDPEARVAYVDNDPIVLVHLRAYYGEKGLAAVSGDLRAPDDLLAHPGLREVIDFSEPVAYILAAVGHFIPIEDELPKKIAALRDAAVPGSYLVLSHVSPNPDLVTPDQVDQSADAYGRSAARAVFRTPGQIRALFDGFTLEEPGLVEAADWNPDMVPLPERSPHILCGVGRLRR